MQPCEELNELIVGTTRDIAKAIAKAEFTSEKAKEQSTVVMAVCAAVNAPLVPIMAEVTGTDIQSEAELVKYFLSHIPEDKEHEVTFAITLAMLSSMGTQSASKSLFGSCK